MPKEIMINGTSLNSKRWNVEYIPEGIPQKRGSNITVPFLDGARWVKKSYGERTDNLNIWILPKDENGVLPIGTTPEEQLEKNMEDLKQILGISGLVTVDKKMNDGTWRTAKAEIVNSIEFTNKNKSDRHVVISVGLQMPDPFWYAIEDKAQNISPNSTSYELTHLNPGTAESRKMQIILTGGLKNPKIENLTTNVLLKLNETITIGSTITIDTEKFTVKDQAGNNLLNSLIHSGYISWMSLAAGNNNLKITTDEVPNGTFKFQYKPAYF
jgi:phage-related protein